MAFTQFGWGTAINPLPESVVTNASQKAAEVPYAVPILAATTPKIALGLEDFSLLLKWYFGTSGLELAFYSGSVRWYIDICQSSMTLNPPVGSLITASRTFVVNTLQDLVIRKVGSSLKIILNGEEIIATTSDFGVTDSFSMKRSSNAGTTSVSYFILSDDPSQNWTGVKCIAGVLNQPPDQFQDWEGDPTVYTANSIETTNPVYSNTAGAVIEHTVTPYVAIESTEKIVRAGVTITNSQDSDFSLSTKVEGDLGGNTFSQALPAAVDPTTTLVTTAFAPLPGDTPFKLFVKVE